MKNYRGFFYASAVLTLFFLSTLSTRAQLPPPPPDQTTEEIPPCWPPPCVPVDGGITFLIVAGAGYAGKKLYQQRFQRQKQDPEN